MDLIEQCYNYLFWGALVVLAVGILAALVYIIRARLTVDRIIGINLVSVLQFAYGSYTGREALRDSALTLLERLPAEDNRYMREWQSAGVRPRNAFESQALLQLATEYCAAKRCAECPVGRRILNNLKIGNN